MTIIHRRKKRKPTQFAPICFLLFAIIGIILYIRCIFIYFQQNNGVSGKGHNNGIGNGSGGHRHGNGHNHGHRNNNPYIADKDMERTKEDAMDNFLGLLQDKEDQQYSTSKNSATANNNAGDADDTNDAHVANNDKPVKKYTDREIYFQMIHKKRNRNRNKNKNLIQYQNVAIPSRIQKLYQTKQIIGQDGLHHVQHDTTPSVGNVAKVIEMRLTKQKSSMEDRFRHHRRPKKEDSQYEYQHQHQYQPRKSDLDMKSDFEIPPELLNFKNKNESKSQSTTTTATTIAMQETISYLQLYLETLDKILKKQTLAFSSSSTSMDKLSFWDMYYIFTHDTLYSWDQLKYQSDIMPMILKQKQKQKSNDNGSNSDSDSIFVSVVSYKDDQRCANTLKSLFDNAHDANRIYVGLVYVTNNEEEKQHQQQRNQTDSNVNDNTQMDNNCLNLFCNQSENNNSIESENIYCQRNQIRSLTMNETISFSPYFARFFASKLWYGEQWYMQIDAHMHFQKDWDETSITMLKHQNLISKEKKKNTKAIISYLPYPYKSNSNHEEVDQQSLPKVCGGYFSVGPWDGQMIRLNTNAVSPSLSSSSSLSSTEENPFVVAGNLITTSDILQEVPFDPFLPFVSKGEEILMSSRLWTSGYDIFHPTVGVVSHEYGIQTIEISTGKNNNGNYIKRVPFWEDEIEQSLGQDGLYHQLQLMVLDRIKHLLNYPESERDMIQSKSLLAGSAKYGLGTFRALKEYMEFAGIDVLTKKSSRESFWCEKS